MGEGCFLACDNCGYKIDIDLGFGSLICLETEETIKKMKSGAYGKKAADFFRENPDGTVDCSYVLLKCDKCGELKNDMDLSLYKRIEGSEDPEFPIPDPDYFVKAEDFEHKCGKCGNTMRIVDTSDGFEEKIQNGEIRCPNCNKKLTLIALACWD